MHFWIANSINQRKRLSLCKNYGHAMCLCVLWERGRLIELLVLQMKISQILLGGDNEGKLLWAKTKTKMYLTLCYSKKVLGINFCKFHNFCKLIIWISVFQTQSRLRKNVLMTPKHTKRYFSNSKSKLKLRTFQLRLICWQQVN